VRNLVLLLIAALCAAIAAAREGFVILDALQFESR